MSAAMSKIVLLVYAIVAGFVALGGATIMQWVTRAPSLWTPAPVAAFVVLTVAGGWAADWVLQLHRDALQQLRQHRAR